MSWISLALLSTLIFSTCVIFDKFFGSHKIKSVYTFAILLALVSLPFVLITTYFMRTTFTVSIGMFYSVAAGLFWFIMWLFYWKALQKGEASRVSAVYFTVPIYSALIGMFFLHEVLTVTKWIGLLIVVIGAILTSIGGAGHKKDKQGAYAFALLAALCGAIGNAISKYAMYSLPPLTVSCIAYYSSIPLYLFLLKDKKVFSEVKETVKNSKHLMLFGVRGLLGYISGLLNMTAMGIGVVSLVTAIGGSQPIMILIISLIASFLFPRVIHEELGRKALIPKLAALLLTVVGIVLISL